MDTFFYHKWWNENMEKKYREAYLITLKSFCFYMWIYFVEILVNFKVNLKQSVL